MKKGQNKPKQITVEYKDESFILAPGHKVFTLNINTGVVIEAELKRKFRLFFWRGPLLGIKKQGAHLLHIPAHDLYKAKIRFKGMVGKHLKIQGL